ncbi:hypothetical protein BK126_28530 [Paenibacillus sp. FSL H7-0326]|uniref:YqbF domain-containing protein n=1 Tax=Paenibacillus sp. FSL H7-0326 TaxID=1921144 RepID=UPI00096D41B9|nr:YqbF domain-containing protein [Paenibacillus sp. FSL H7-0326]OMC62646.1 hypothetical protein BK126_28530 [Paenibacillus sp. FSL H7-0326]
MYYFAKLIKGNEYSVKGMTFKCNQEAEVTKSMYEYLKNKKEEFEVRDEPKLHHVSIKKVIEE